MSLDESEIEWNAREFDETFLCSSSFRRATTIRETFEVVVRELSLYIALECQYSIGLKRERCV